MFAQGFIDQKVGRCQGEKRVFGCVGKLHVLHRGEDASGLQAQEN